MKTFYLLLTLGLFASFSLCEAYGSSSSSSSTSGSTPLPAFPKLTPAAKSAANPKLPAKSALPKKETQQTMEKPLGMPGVVGIVNERWANSDYLGFLEPNFPFTVEVVLGKGSPRIDDASIENALMEVLKGDNITTFANQSEGPILPFLHLLVMVYPIDKNSFAIFAALRLFENVTIKREKFEPAGYWQAVTWENQDMIVSTGEQLQAQINAIATKLATSFIKRYDEYNKERPKRPEPIKPY